MPDNNAWNHVDPVLRRRVRAVAHALGRRTSELVAEALAQYLATQHADVEARLADLPPGAGR